MTRYNVHIDRIVKLAFHGIEASSPERAANIARAGLNSDADELEDSGEDISALIDVAGDEDFSQSVTIDFEPERARTAAHGLLAALERIIPYAENEARSLDDLKDGPEAEAEAARAWKSIEAAHAAVADARAAGITPPALATPGSRTVEAEAQP
jgi:hypothetical protein